MKREAATDIPGADERRREQARIRREYPDLYYYVAGVALVVALMLVGYVLFPDRDGYVTNLFTEAASVAVTLLVLNRMAEAREERRRKERLKQDLIHRMGSSVNPEAIRAAEELRLHEWLTDGSLRGISFAGATLKRAPLEDAQLEQTNLMHVDFQEAILPRANLNGASLIKAKLNGAILVDAKLRRVNFLGADFQGAELKSADFTGAVRDGTNYVATLRELAALGTWQRELVRAIWHAFTAPETINFEGATLTRAIFEGADLTNAVFKDAILIKVNLTGAILTGANLDGADLTGATLPNGDKWHPGYDMTVFTSPPDEAADRHELPLP